MIKKIKVVIADDLEPILLYLEKLISEVPEFEIVGKAKNGKELIDLVRENKPDLVITDIQMPYYDGIQAIEQIHKLGIKCKYILITSSSNYIITCKAQQLGILKVIKKPILDNNMFINQIKEILNRENNE